MKMGDAGKEETMQKGIVTYSVATTSFYMEYISLIMIHESWAFKDRLRTMT